MQTLLRWGAVGIAAVGMVFDGAPATGAGQGKEKPRRSGVRVVLDGGWVSLQPVKAPLFL